MDIFILFNVDVNVRFLCYRNSMISQTTEYALRAMALMATQPENAWTKQELAAKTKVSGDYLSKVLQSLTKAGLARSTRGASGGYSLAFRPSRITILQIVQAVDPIQRITRCPLNLKAHAKKLCALHCKIDTAIAQTEKTFANATLASVLDGMDHLHAGVQ